MQWVGFLGHRGSSRFQTQELANIFLLGTTARADIGLENLAPDFGAILVKSVKSNMGQPTLSVGLEVGSVRAWDL